MANRRGLRIALGTVAVGAVLVAVLVGLRGRAPEMAPDFVVPDLEGKAVHLSGLRGRVVVLNLWTTWCPPCREEMPSMQMLYDALAGPDFELLAVSQDEGGAAVVAPFVRELGVTFPVLVDPQRQVGERYGVWGYPETFVIDRAGRIAERVIGPRDWASPERLTSLRALMAADPPAPAS
jgi:peroxiredoxin